MSDSKTMVFTVNTTTLDHEGVHTEQRQVEVTLVADFEAGLIRYVPTDPAETHQFPPLPIDDVPELVGLLVEALTEGQS